MVKVRCEGKDCVERVRKALVGGKLTEGIIPDVRDMVPIPEKQDDLRKYHEAIGEYESLRKLFDKYSTTLIDLAASHDIDREPTEFLNTRRGNVAPVADVEEE